MARLAFSSAPTSSWRFAHKIGSADELGFAQANGQVASHSQSASMQPAILHLPQFLPRQAFSTKLQDPELKIMLAIESTAAWFSIRNNYEHSTPLHQQYDLSAEI